MNKPLNGEQISAYHEDGFIAPIDFLSPERAADILAQLDRATQSHPDALKGPGRNNPHLVLTCLDELIHDARMLDLVEQLLGPDLLVYGSVIFDKAPNSAGFVSWHQDATYMGLTPGDGLTAWIALTDSTRENGCVSMMPGSHRDGIRDHEDTYNNDNILTRGQRVRNIDETQAVDVCLRAGQMSFHHTRTVHGSQPNTSDRRRMGIAVQSYITPSMRPTLNDVYVQLARGSDSVQHFIHTRRPIRDLADADIVRRDRVNAALRDILYHNARQRRDY